MQALFDRGGKAAVFDADGDRFYRLDFDRESGKILVLSGEALALVARKVLQERFPERWAEIEKEMKSQRENLAEARRLLAAKKPQDALAALGNVVGSEVRFTEEWADARKLLAETEKKVAAEEKKAER